MKTVAMEEVELKPSLQEQKSSKYSVDNENVAMEVDEFKPNIKEEKSSEDSVDEFNGVPESAYECPSSHYITPCKTESFQNGADCLHLEKEAVVVLTRLPEHVISALQSSTAQELYSETESFGEAESDTLWEPGEDSDDSDIPLSHNNRKTTKMKKSGASEKSKQTLSINSLSTAGKVDESRSSVPEPQSSKDSIENNNETKAGCSVISTYVSHCNNETKIIRPDLPEKEILPGMMVIARRRAMEWKRGKIAEINTREDGRLKYKVVFEEKGKSLVSGHHIAFDSTARLAELYIGARVVVKSLEDELTYLPGVLGELPSRKNRLRFLVFVDDHTAVYVGLPLLHLVCRPLENVLDDVPSGIHKYFMTQYLKRWPYPHLTRYRVGQIITVDVNGVPEKCEVLSIDCSLILVLYQHNQTREWIHRGSIRLEHIFKLLKTHEQTNLSAEESGI
ncbi:histone-lysine N-methyltransferase SETDB1-B isoform X2 [Oryzias latipes]|uniref:histone-lysine N-methyltransferase SETDB1-B isoform X2 n=1 Tax=Oryzias latipes TaxID=8090 RepID=UPI0005CC593D|nr:histone-lysine N-methyltransferase SETDB1-B isoform X2 [Oryzias latipes]